MLSQQRGKTGFEISLPGNTIDRRRHPDRAQAVFIGFVSHEARNSDYIKVRHTSGTEQSLQEILIQHLTERSNCYGRNGSLRSLEAKIVHLRTPY